MTLRLNQLLQESGHPPLDAETGQKFAAYLALLQKWNARTNLTSIRDEEGIREPAFSRIDSLRPKLTRKYKFPIGFWIGSRLSRHPYRIDSKRFIRNAR